jgi:hypothetical protein
MPPPMPPMSSRAAKPAALDDPPPRPPTEGEGAYDNSTFAAAAVAKGSGGLSSSRSSVAAGGGSAAVANAVGADLLAAATRHGTALSRQAAETLLAPHPVGTYLVRISSKTSHHVVSFSDATGMRHYELDDSSGFHIIKVTGIDTSTHPSIAALLRFYTVTAITKQGSTLGSPCP